MLLNKENAFVGAIVRYKDRDFTIIKVNLKTVYISQDKELLKKIRLKLKGIKAIDLIKSNSVMVDMTEIEIDEKELKKKDIAEKSAELKKKQKRVLSSVAQKYLDMKIAKAMNPKDKTGSWKNMFDCGAGSLCTILVFNREKKMALISIDGEKYFYVVDLDVYVPFVDAIHKNGYGDSSILWNNVIV